MKRFNIIFFLLITTFSLSAQEVDSIIDIRDGQVYKIVKIGQQWWMAENLNVGTRIPGDQELADNLIIEKYCYNNNDSLCDIYGGLYQWDEMMDYDSSGNNNPEAYRGICPLGWHLPADDEWKLLELFLGMSQSEVDGEIWRGTDEGGKLKESGFVHWEDPNTGGTNESGFTALPGGYRHRDGYFDNINNNAYLWSSTEGSVNGALDRRLSYTRSKVYRLNNYKNQGSSVRCIRDYSHIGWVTILDENMNSVSDIKLTGDYARKKLIIFNSGAGVNISSVYNNNSVFNLNFPDSVLLPGDSIHISLTYNAPGKGFYQDSIYIERDDTNDPVIKIPIEGINYTEAPCGVIAEDTTWTKDNSPYYIGCNLAIAHDVTLTIEPGVTVMIDSMHKIVVDGYIIAEGAKGDSILFTNSCHDVFDQINFRQIGGGRFDYFALENSITGFNIEAGEDTIFLSNGRIENCVTGFKVSSRHYNIENLLIRKCQYGIHDLGYDARNCIISNCTVKRNEHFGIKRDTGNAVMLIQDCDISYNGTGLYCMTNSVIQNNRIYHNNTGVFLVEGDLLNNQIYDNFEDAVWSMGSNIKNNIILNNKGNGISELPWYYSHNIIEYNRIMSNQNGVRLVLNSEVKFNRISDNTQAGILTSSIPVINSNDLLSNGTYNVHATKQDIETINAEGNYWGTENVSVIENSIYDYFDDGVTVIVDYDPFLSEEISSSHIDFAPDIVSCYGDDMTALEASGDSVLWFSEPDYTGLLHTGSTYETGKTDPGIFTYYVTQNLNDSTVLKDTASLIISTNPVVNSVNKTNETTCNSDDGTITIDASDNYSLVYSVDGGSNYFDNDGAFTGLSNGNYQVLVKNENGCTVSGGAVEIISEGVIPPAPTAGKDTTYCPGDEIVDLTATAETGGTITWYSDPVLSSVIGSGATYSPGNLTETATFYVTETKDNCESPSSEVRIRIRNEPVYEGSEICLVTNSMYTGDNLVVWERTPEMGIASYNIYRETSAIGQYELLGNVPYNQISVFGDTTANPEESQSLYKITAVDSCGNESEKSAYHKTFFLQYVGSTGGVNLQWSHYAIEGGEPNFITYEILRGDYTTTLTKIAEVSGSIDRYTDTDPEAVTKPFFYRVAGLLAEPCDPTGTLKCCPEDLSRSKSNFTNNDVVSIHEQRVAGELNTWPNPFSHSTLVNFNNPEGYEYTMFIMDISGKVCRVVEGIKTSEFLLEKRDLKEGLYFIVFRGPGVYRGKVVIE